MGINTHASGGECESVSGEEMSLLHVERMRRQRSLLPGEESSPEGRTVFVSQIFVFCSPSPHTKVRFRSYRSSFATSQVRKLSQQETELLVQVNKNSKPELGLRHLNASESQLACSG